MDDTPQSVGHLALIAGAISDPGSFTPRGDHDEEPLPFWEARAVLLALASDGWALVTMEGPDAE